ncbi:MAG TPA: hypothetical protein VK610_09805, partial [Rhodothermales bacterium]|nr:hypothetical protein [Rhodothermales bacterium]
MAERPPDVRTDWLTRFPGLARRTPGPEGAEADKAAAADARGRLMAIVVSLCVATVLWFTF